MRWCSFTTASDGSARLGAVSPQDDTGRVLDVAGWARSRDAQSPQDLIDLVESSPATQQRVTDLVRSAPPDGVGWVRPDEVRLLAPLRTPGSLRHVVARSGAVPVFSHVARRVVTGPDEDVALPPYARELVVVCQVAAVVGRRGRDLSPAEAVETVLGYTLMAQWAAPEVGREVATSLGPWVVTPDEWEPRAGHAVQVDVEGGAVFRGTTDERPWTFGQALAWVSQGEDLWPADVVGLGGGGQAVGPGQQVAVTVEGLGTLTARLSPASP